MPAPTLPYVPNSMSPGDVNQWADQFAMAMATAYANGSIQSGPGSLFDNSVYQGIMGAGAATLDPSGYGSGITQAQTINLLRAYALKLAPIWNTLSATQKQGVADPTGLPQSGGPIAGENLSPTDKTNLTTVQTSNADIAARTEATRITEAGANTRAAAAEAGSNARDAADNARAREIAQLQESGANSRNAATIASQERVSSADRAEKSREFDVTTKANADALQADMGYKMLSLGVDLMKNPVDWVAYQYYLSKTNLPLTANNYAAAAAVFGAIPPTGPSAAGPVIGGPAVMHGDTTTAQALGITNAGPVSIAQAVQANPGAAQWPVAAQSSATSTVQQNGGAQQLDQQLAQARTQELPTSGLHDTFTQQAVQQAQQIVSEARTNMLAQGAQPQAGGPPPVPTSNPNGAPPPAAPPAAGQDWGAPPPQGGQPGAIPPNPALPGAQPGMTGGPYTGNEEQQAPPAIPPNPVASLNPNAGAAPAAGAPMPVGNVAAQPIDPGFASTAGPIAPGTPKVGNPMTTMPLPAVDAMQGTPSGGTVAGAPLTPQPIAAQPTPGGILGAQPTAAGGQPAAGQPAGSNGNIMQLLQQIATATGMSLDQVKALFPANLMTPAYSSDVIQNAPIVKSLQGSGNSGLSGFYTGDPGTGLSTIKATGTDIGVRGGQDYNAGTYLGATQGQQGLLQGAVQSAGQYWPDFMQQMLRASPVSNLDVGSQSSRSFQ